MSRPSASSGMVASSEEGLFGNVLRLLGAGRIVKEKTG
jgi:hypothetical protein